MKKILNIAIMFSLGINMNAQTVSHFITTENAEWKTCKKSMSKKPIGKVVIEVSKNQKGVPFAHGERLSTNLTLMPIILSQRKNRTN